MLQQQIQPTEKHFLFFPNNNQRIQKLIFTSALLIKMESSLLAPYPVVLYIPLYGRYPPYPEYILYPTTNYCSITNSYDTGH